MDHSNTSSLRKIECDIGDSGRWGISGDLYVLRRTAVGKLHPSHTYWANLVTSIVTHNSIYGMSDETSPPLMFVYF